MEKEKRGERRAKIRVGGLGKQRGASLLDILDISIGLGSIVKKRYKTGGFEIDEMNW